MRIPSFDFQTRLPFWSFSLLAGLAATAYSFAIVSIALLLGSPDAPPGPDETLDRWLVVWAVVFAPLIETFLLWLVVSVLGRFIANRAAVTCITALLFGAGHGPSLAGFVGAIGPFAVFSYSFLTWRRVGAGHAYGAATIAHAIVNASLLSVGYIALRFGD